MRKLSEIRGEDAIEVLAQIVEPAAEIMSDKEIVSAARGEKRIRLVSLMLKTHKTEVLQIMAALDGVDYEDEVAYKQYVDSQNLLSLPKALLDIVNDKDLMDLFTSQGQDETSSGSAMESTEAAE